ncbi:uncharacterized protein LOC111265390 isoform X2 [Varroa jacobsoni]|uniref:Uncharacterized protein n=2 Tax=Varroa TaxID=62624 RepID=A0A7M7KIS8_VARDE|nr:uncharacterized protein LOC111253039 [Varroa destructor]XP_022667591.1 uncharacterized protein LOC111253039 [Varroa destructor]XP_022697744.1 uncharacterized protein LOC111265390 isoform X2 [Varroa jacobsoni]XP_022697745.1 uncharacterized protein LOC111265390 isoform X2 [Varroa jacobsoni]XP_022697746.1 uncharacterized protein LOC111265390 isoform X2 [Varroa jacobsoni]
MGSGCCLSSATSPAELVSTPVSCPQSSKVASSKSSVYPNCQGQPLELPAEDDDSDLPIWACQCVHQAENSVVLHSGLIVSIVPHLESVALPDRRLRRRWDVPLHGQCFFAKASDATESTSVKDKVPTKASTRNSTPTPSTSKSISSRQVPGSRLRSTLCEDQESVPRMSKATRRVVLTRRVVFGGLTGGSKPVSKSGLVQTSLGKPNGQLAAVASSESVARLIKPFVKYVNVDWYNSLYRSQFQQSNMYSLVFQDRRITRFKRPLQTRTSQLLFGSVLSNKTTSLRLARFGLYQISPDWGNSDSFASSTDSG